MIININEFYNNKNWKQYVPLEAFQEEMRLVGETFLKDVKVKNVLSITYSIDDYGENPIYIEYLDENDQKHLVKLKPAIHEELESVLSKYATIDYTNQKFAEAVQTSKDYTDQAKEALTVLINGSKEEAIQISKAYTDVEINKLNTNLREYIDSQDQTLMQNIITYSENSVNAAVQTATAYTNEEISKAKQEVKDYADTQDNAKLVESKEYTDAKHEESLRTISPLASKLDNIWGEHKAPFIYWLPNIDVNTMELVNLENDVKVTLNAGDVVYWRKNAYQPVDLSGIEEEVAQSLVDAKAYTDTQLTNYETKADATTDHNKLMHVPTGKKEPYIRWYPSTDCNHIKFTLSGGEIGVYIDKSDEGEEKVGYLSSRNPSTFATKTEVENANKVYGYDTTSDSWNKCDGNFTVAHDGANITKLGYRQTVDGTEKTLDFIDFATKLDALFFRGTVGAQNPSLNNLEQGFYHFYFENENTDSTYPTDMQGQMSVWGSILQMGYTNGLCSQLMIRVPSDTMYIRTHSNGGWNSWHKVTAPLANVQDEMLNLETVEAVVQAQNALNTENVPVSLQQKTRTLREVINNSTLVNTKDFMILNLDFSFVPNVLPTSVETSFIENITIDAPEFNGKSFDITFKANEHTTTSKGVIGEPLTIKTCVFPVDETIQTVKVVVKDKIIIRKETE